MTAEGGGGNFDGPSQSYLWSLKISISGRIMMVGRSFTAGFVNYDFGLFMCVLDMISC